MALYPQTPIPAIPYPHTDSYLTIRSGKFESGVENVRSARLYPLFSARITYPTLTWSDYATLYAFFNTVKGAWGTFTFEDFLGHDASPVGIAWPKLYVGVGDGTSNKIYDVPMFSSSTYTLYDNGTPMVADAGDPPAAGKYHFYSGGGTDGRDRVKLATATTGHLFEWQATGRRAVNARFDVDEISFNSLYAALTSTGVVVTEAR